MLARNYDSQHDISPSNVDKRLEGLFDRPRRLPPKLFYDARGAELFEKITTLDEYYPTRTERGILERNGADIASAVGKERVIIEYGSGAAEKIRLLLPKLLPCVYVPVDVSGEQLHQVSEELKAKHSGIDVIPVEADFTVPFALPAHVPLGRRLAVFLGSTIGNMEPEEARVFLRRVAWQIGRDGMLLLGVDLRKDPAILHAAYNDKSGVTAEFNKNVLVRLQREFDVTVDPDAFAHYAFYNPVAGRVEMHLVATTGTEIDIGHSRLTFVPGESIWTESSYKYTRAELTSLASETGFAISAVWADPDNWFALALLAPARS